MRGFILGIILTLLVLGGGAYFYTTSGHFDACCRQYSQHV